MIRYRIKTFIFEFTSTISGIQILFRWHGSCLSLNTILYDNMLRQNLFKVDSLFKFEMI